MHKRLKSSMNNNNLTLIEGTSTGVFKVIAEI